MNDHLKKRTRRENIFQTCGILALLLSAGFLVLLISAVSWRGFSALSHYEIALPINTTLLQETLEESAAEEEPDYGYLLAESLLSLFPQATSRADQRNLLRYVPSAYAESEIIAALKSAEKNNLPPNQQIWFQQIWPQQIWISLGDRAIDFLKNGSHALPETLRSRLTQLLAEGQIRSRFNYQFFLAGDSREPEHAGIRAAFIGSLWLMLITFIISFPIGVLAAIYLQEFAPRNKWSSLIETNINNLASVPSIIFGLMGLALFLNWFGLPRSSPLVGGMVLSLMTLPTIIIATRASLAAVPPSVREAALALGASHMQSVFHHAVPLALPGILTGSIIGMARALGETAPLLMIGMVAFIAETPQSAADAATVLPVQIYIWADSPERGFADKASAAIIVLLLFLIIMNTIAIFLRRYFAHRW